MLNIRNIPLDMCETLPAGGTLQVQGDKAAPLIAFPGADNESGLTTYPVSSIAAEDRNAPVT